MFMVANATPAPGQGASPTSNLPRKILDVSRRAAARAVLDSAALMLHDAADGGWAEALERGRIVHFPRCPIALPGAGEQDFLRQGLSPFLQSKNVSFYPDA